MELPQRTSYFTPNPHFIPTQHKPDCLRIIAYKLQLYNVSPFAPLGLPL